MESNSAADIERLDTDLANPVFAAFGMLTGARTKARH